MCGNLGGFKDSVSRAKEVTWGLSIEAFYPQPTSPPPPNSNEMITPLHLANPKLHSELIAPCRE